MRSPTARTHVLLAPAVCCCIHLLSLAGTGPASTAAAAAARVGGAQPVADREPLAEPVTVAVQVGGGGGGLGSLPHFFRATGFMPSRTLLTDQGRVNMLMVGTPHV